MLTDHAHIPRWRGEASGGCWGCCCWQPLQGGEKIFTLVKLVQFKKTYNQMCYSPIFSVSRPWSASVGGDGGRKNGLQAVDLVSSGVQTCGVTRQPVVAGTGWINSTRTPTPGQPAALTRGFLKPVPIPNWTPKH